ncbi:MAG: hypothetical protein GXP31_11975 [Kiritimatiellaeota bacterium]|nr:hypothetical protein [Kiritimatiellota bacterium]
MTPRQRLLAALHGRPVDRVPLELPGFLSASREQARNHPDPLGRRIAERIVEHTPFYVQAPSFINRMLVTPPQRVRQQVENHADGGRTVHGAIDTPKGKLTFARAYNPTARTWWQVKYPVENREDIDKIVSVPWELPTGLAPPEDLELPPDFSERGILETRISSPFVCVAAMMNYEWFLELALTEPTLIAELTDICRRRILAVLSVLLSRPGIEYVWLGGSEWVTPPMASPQIYDALVQEQERDLIDYVHSHSDAVVHVHCHGRVRHALPRTIERGGDYTEPVEPPPDGDILLEEAKELAAGRITLGGNIECRILCNEDEAAVEAAVRTAFRGGKQRFILRPTEGPSSPMTENEFRNYMRMVDCWEELSPV